MEQEENYKVYMHTNKINDKKYIGITRRNVNDRWMNGRGYQNQMFGRAIKKYGWDNFKHEVLYENLTKEEAEQKEIELIARYKSDNGDYGYNVEHGGNCSDSMAESTKKKLSEVMTGKFVGRKLTPEWLENRTKAQTGLKRSKETVEKIREANSIKVICVNNRIIYSSITDASNKTNISMGHISQCCNKIRKSAGIDEYGVPLFWMFYDEYMEINGEHKSNEEIIPKRFRPYPTPRNVICLNDKTVYASGADAARKTNASKSGISNCCNHKTQYSGTDNDGNRLCWMFYDEYLKAGDLCA